MSPVNWIAAYDYLFAALNSENKALYAAITRDAKSLTIICSGRCLPSV